MSLKNHYLIENLDNFIELSAAIKEYQNQFISELIHSSFLIAHDENKEPIILSINSKDYALLFSDDEEFKKAFPDDKVSSIEFKLSTLIEILKDFKLGGYILNVSSQNFYLTENLLKGLKDLPSNLISSNKTYDSQELKNLKDSIDNHDLEEFIKTPGNFTEFFKLMSSAVLFALVESEQDMGILESEGIIDTMGLKDKYEYHSHNNYVTLFTRKEKIKNIETSKFKYLSLVNFSSLVHYTIKEEFNGIVINPDDESYIIPVDVLIKNWSLINQTCWDERLVSANYNVFPIED